MLVLCDVLSCFCLCIQCKWTTHIKQCACCAVQFILFHSGPHPVAFMSNSLGLIRHWNINDGEHGSSFSLLTPACPRHINCLDFTRNQTMGRYIAVPLGTTFILHLLWEKVEGILTVGWLCRFCVRNLRINTLVILNYQFF